MIGSGNISSYGSHDHTVTKCLHETHDIKPKQGGSGAGGLSSAAAQTAQKQESFSLTDVLTDAWNRFLSKTSGLFGRIRRDSAEGTENKTTGRDTARYTPEHPANAVAAGGTEQAAMNPAAAEVLAAAAVSAWQSDKRNTAQINETKEMRTEGTKKKENLSAAKAKTADDNTESAADGALRREKGENFKFLSEFGKAAAVRIKRYWNDGEEPEKTEEKQEEYPEGGREGFAVGDSSYLLDSYNCSGEYSTLAKDRSLEGNFQAKG